MKKNIYIIGVVLESLLLVLMVNPLIGFIWMFKQKAAPEYVKLPIDDRIIMYGCAAIFVLVIVLISLIGNIVLLAKKDDSIVKEKTFFVISCVGQVLLILVPIVFTIFASLAFEQRALIIYYSNQSQFCLTTTVFTGFILAGFGFVKNILIRKDA